MSQFFAATAEAWAHFSLMSVFRVAKVCVASSPPNQLSLTWFPTAWDCLAFERQFNVRVFINIFVFFFFPLFLHFVNIWMQYLMISWIRKDQPTWTVRRSLWHVKRSSWECHGELICPLNDFGMAVVIQPVELPPRDSPTTDVCFAFQGTRMEERLDDAINVLRSHCEPQMNLPLGMDGAGLSGHASFVPSQAPQNQTAGSSLNQDPSVSLPLDIPVKVERTSVPSASSKSRACFVSKFLINFHSRKEKRASRCRHEAEQQLSECNGS